MNVRHVFLLLGCGAALLCGLHAAPQEPGDAPSAKSFTVAFWNIQWFPGGRPSAYKGEQVRQIRSVHADIEKFSADLIAMEEVRDWEGAALAIEPLSGFKVDVVSNFPPREGQNETQQVAIASRWQPMSAWAEEWKAGDLITPPRGFAFAAYEIAPQKILLVYALHLKSNRGELVEDMAIRSESIRQLLDHMRAMENAYGKLGALTWIVGGDFNTDPADQRFRAEKSIPMLIEHGMRWIWQNVPIENRVTLPPDKRFPAASFDHIFYRGATLKNARVVPTMFGSSDHRGIEATFSLDQP